MKKKNYLSWRNYTLEDGRISNDVCWDVIEDEDGNVIEWIGLNSIRSADDAENLGFEWDGKRWAMGSNPSPSLKTAQKFEK